jgi:hypothetical protein
VVTAIVALGANLKEPRKTFAMALEKLQRIGRLLAKSQLYDTEAEGPEQPRYHNAILLFETDFVPSRLLAAAQSIEAEAGRDRLISILSSMAPSSIKRLTLRSPMSKATYDALSCSLSLRWPLIGYTPPNTKPSESSLRRSAPHENKRSTASAPGITKSPS